MNKIFLGGTCADTTWRDELIEILKPYQKNQDINWFNPVVEDWTPDCQAIEEDEKNNKCNIHLYMITPEMQGVYSIAEIINSCWQAIVYGTTVNKVMFYIYDHENKFNKQQIKSLNATIRLCKDIGDKRFIGKQINNLKEIIDDLYIMNIFTNANVQPKNVE